MKEGFLNNVIKKVKVDELDGKTISEIIGMVTEKVQKGEPLTAEDQELFRKAVNGGVGIAELENKMNAIKNKPVEGVPATDDSEAPSEIV